VEDIDETWLTAALGSRWPGIVVDSVARTGLVRGAATKVRLRPEYAPSGYADLPGSVWVKIGLEPHSAYLGEVVQIYANEARAYAEVLPHVDINRPCSFHTATQESPGQGVVVLEDLGERGVVLPEPPAPLTVAQVDAGLGQLAALHGQTWSGRSPSAAVLGNVMDGASSSLYDSLITAVDGAMKSIRAFAAPWSLLDRDRFVEGLAAYRAWVAEGPACLLHGDAHMNNLYFERDGSAGFLDWQMCGHGRWAHDVGYFVGSALDLTDRRDHEEALLRSYIEALGAAGAPAPGFNEAWLDYRRSVFFGFAQFLFNWDSTQAPEYNMAAFARFAAAMVDLRTYEALGV
jgi:hypothetical protein